MVRFLIIIAGLCSLLMSCTKKPDITYQVLGAEPLKKVTLPDESSSSLIEWARGGYRDMTVINVSPSDGMAFLPDEKIGTIKKLIREQKWDKLEKARDVGYKGLFDRSNYLYAAVRLGIVRKIYWVIPQRFFEYVDVERRVKNYLSAETSLFDQRDIDKMGLRGGCVSGSFYGAKLNICSPETLPAITEPVLLDIGSDFFTVFSAGRQTGVLAGLKLFFDVMNGKSLRVVSADVAFSERSTFKKPFHSYIGYQVAEALKNPSIMQASDPPLLWRERDLLESFLAGGSPRDTVEAVDALSPQHADETSLLTFKAVGLAFAGRTDASLRIFEERLKKERGRIGVLVFVGKELAGAKKTGEAGRFFVKALEWDPVSPGALLGYADMQYGQQAYLSALDLYEKAEERVDSLYLQLRIGDCLYYLDRKDEAAAHYEKASAMFEEKIRFEMSGQNKGSLERMLELSAAGLMPKGASMARLLLNSG